MTYLRIHTLSRATALGFAAAALAAHPARAQQPTTGQVRVFQRMPAPQSDSLVARIYNSDVAEVKRIVRAWRDKEQELIGQLRTVPDNDFPARRRIEDQLAYHTRDAFRMMSAVQARCPDAGRGTPPAGYLGLNTTTEGVISNGETRGFKTFVESIEQGSPAERAGFKAGDRVLAIEGFDPWEMQDIGPRLVPGRTVTVRIERDGAPTEMTVVVAKRPPGFGEACGELISTLMPMRIPGGVFVGNPRERDSLVITMRSSEPMFPRQGSPTFFAPQGMRMVLAYFAGAEFRALDADWQERLGVKEGVLVSQVAAESQAAAAGLKGGDVITHVNKVPVRSPDEAIRRIESRDGGQVELTVRRGRDRKTIQFQLGPR